jgi:hypothetical protein
MSETVRVLRSQALAEAHHRLTTRPEYVATDRVTGVSTGTELFDLFVGVPDDADVEALVAVSIGTGGLAHVDTTDGASVDTSGTDLPVQSKGADGDAMTTTVERGGTYSATGTTLPTLALGTERDGGPITSTGARALSDVRLLTPGEGVRYQPVNESGSTVDADVQVSVIEIEPSSV